jgi:hypothetical protein
VSEDPKVLVLHSRKGLIDNPETIQQQKKNTGQLPALSRVRFDESFTVKNANVGEIMAVVESPSHWRYFENKRKIKQNQYSMNFDVFPKT